jgi:hypothetical protein
MSPRASKDGFDHPGKELLLKTKAISTFSWGDTRNKYATSSINVS